MPTGVHPDGDFSARSQHGDAIEVPLLLERCRLFRVTYLQYREGFNKSKPSFADRGEAGTDWANLAAVEFSEPSDEGGGVCKFTITYAQKPLRLPETEPFTFEYQYIIDGEIVSVSKCINSGIAYAYYLTPNSGSIAVRTVFRAVKVGNTIRGIGTVPGEGAFICEDEHPERWRGNWWVVKTRTAPPEPLSIL